MSAKLQVLMPMGGLGSRFANAGYDTPKPLIEVDGKPMFMRALESFKSVDDKKYIFVIRKEHDEKYDLKQAIQDQLPSADVLLLDHDTGGAVETCMIARDVIDDTLPISVADCDIYFESEEYFEKIAGIQSNGIDGMLLTFTSNDPRYSYVKLNETGQVERTAEKIVISEHAILGGYFFASGVLLKELADTFLSQPLPEGLKEYYMSHLFNILLARDGSVETANIDKKYIFGTPEELNAYMSGTQDGS